jgi:hypothetical protein
VPDKDCTQASSNLTAREPRQMRERRPPRLCRVRTRAPRRVVRIADGPPPQQGRAKRDSATRRSRSPVEMIVTRVPQRASWAGPGTQRAGTLRGVGSGSAGPQIVMSARLATHRHARWLTAIRLSRGALRADRCPAQHDPVRSSPAQDAQKSSMALIRWTPFSTVIAMSRL